MQTIFSTGIRVSELRFITTEAVHSGKVQVQSKGKHRTVFLVSGLKKLLLQYIKREKVRKGSVFVTRNGNPLSRSKIWAAMKALCEDAKVERGKVFPHNLRHLFVKVFYQAEKDLGRLADILGHSNVNTTRIYTLECGRTHEKILQRLDFSI
jgi:Site-specific recombinase XerD